MSEADELLKINQELRDAIRARDEFLAIAAHELRNPMHALLLQVESALAIARRDGGDELLQRLERVKLVLDRYIKRATLLLEVSRLNAGGAELRFEDLDIAEVLRDLVDTYSVEADFHRVSIQVSAPDSLCGQWDRLAIEQVIGNLLSNAIKYGDGHPVAVTLACDAAAARLTVQDRGIGISPDNQARIFGRFEQVVTEHPRTGFGVGLWLARSLMEAHRGSITVSSTPGLGSVFTICLPLNPTSNAAETT